MVQRYLGGAQIQFRTIATHATGLPGDYMLAVTSTGASIGVWLPVDALPGQVYVVKDAAGGAGVSYPITVRGATGFIDGSPTGVQINNGYGRRGFVNQATGVWLTS